MTDDEAVDDLAAEWHAAVERGEAVSPAEICRDRPELTDKVIRRVGPVLRVQALMPPAEPLLNGTSLETVAQGAAAVAPPPDAPAGYELLDKLGEGGMGVVYKARNATLKRIEAVKLTRGGESSGPKVLARFRFEAEAAAGLDHPHIVKVYAVGEGPTGPFIAMQYVEGESLEKQPPADARGIAAVLAKVSRAVEFAHRQGILHRDLKPANILMDPAREPFVSDFGIARRLDADANVTQAGIPIGTAAYMAPEQARGDAILTEAADVYSLGVVLYRLLTGQLPFGGSREEVLRKVQTENAHEPRQVDPDADPDLSAVCLKCMEKDPADRYRNAGELAADLERYLRGEAVTARPPGFWDWVRQLARTRPERNVYAWQLLVWFGFIHLFTHVGVSAAVWANAGVGWVWGAMAAAGVGFAVTLWWYQFRRFRHVPREERHSAMIAAGHLLAQTALLVLLPMNFTSPAREALHYYPPLTALSGLGLFVLGSTHWGRFVLLGVVVLLLIPMMAVWPLASPLLYGGTMAAVMWYWAYSLWVEFGRTKPG